MGELLDAVPEGGGAHEEHHRDLATAVEALGGDVITLRKSAPVTLSSADILGLHTTPVTIVAAPGAGKTIDLHRVLFQFRYGTAPYSTTDLSGVAFQFAGAGDRSLGNVGDLTLTESLDASYTTDAFGGVPADITNKALQVVAANGSTIFADGDSSVTITAWYSIEDVP